MLEEYKFNDSNHALIWSVEFLRARRFPKIASFYRESEQVQNGEILKWRGEVSVLPDDPEERLLLAIKVQKIAKECLSELEWQIVQFFYWGDFLNDESYGKAVKFKEQMRRQGVRVRLSYRYSFRHIGRLINFTHRSVSIKHREALEKIGLKLEEKRLL